MGLLVDAFKNSNVGHLMADVYNERQFIFISLAMSFVWCLIFMKLMSAFAEQLAWCVIIITQLGLLGACGASFYVYRSTTDESR